MVKFDYPYNNLVICKMISTGYLLEDRTQYVHPTMQVLFNNCHFFNIFF